MSGSTTASMISRGRYSGSAACSTKYGESVYLYPTTKQLACILLSVRYDTRIPTYWDDFDERNKARVESISFSFPFSARPGCGGKETK